MPDLILRGTPEPQRQSYGERFSPSGGYAYTAEWRGFNGPRMRNFAQVLAANGVQYEYQEAHGVFSLRVTDSTQENTIDTWEIALNKLSPSSLENPRLLLPVNGNSPGVSANDRAVIARAVKDGTKFSEAIAALEKDVGGTWTEPAKGNTAAQRLYDRLKKGSDSFYNSSYVLRHTTNVNNRWNVNVADWGVDMIYTTADLLAETQSAAAWVFPLPGRLAYKIAMIVADALATYGSRDYYRWGWLKSGSSESTAANNRVNIVTEYEFGQWSTDEYAEW